MISGNFFYILWIWISRGLPFTGIIRKKVRSLPIIPENAEPVDLVEDSKTSGHLKKTQNFDYTGFCFPEYKIVILEKTLFYDLPIRNNLPKTFPVSHSKIAVKSLPDIRENYNFEFL